MFDVLNECHNNDSVVQLRVTSGEMGSIQVQQTNNLDTSSLYSNSSSMREMGGL